jgi:hypothetical protein
MKFSSVSIYALLVASASGFVTNQVVSVPSKSALNLAIGESAPDFALTDQNGKVIQRSVGVDFAAD